MKEIGYFQAAFISSVFTPFSSSPNAVNSWSKTVEAGEFCFILCLVFVSEQPFHNHNYSQTLFAFQTDVAL